MGRETVLFFVLNGLGLAIQPACIGITNYGLGRTDKLAANIALLMGICLGTLFRFWSYRRWVWTDLAGGSAQDPAECEDIADHRAAPRQSSRPKSA